MPDPKDPKDFPLRVTPEEAKQIAADYFPNAKRSVSTRSSANNLLRSRVISGSIEHYLFALPDSERLRHGVIGKVVMPGVDHIDPWLVAYISLKRIPDNPEAHAALARYMPLLNRTSTFLGPPGRMQVLPRRLQSIESLVLLPRVGYLGFDWAGEAGPDMESVEAGLRQLSDKLTEFGF